MSNKIVSFKMPHVCLGQIVLWSQHPGEEYPCAALVNGVGHNVISLAVFPPGMVNHLSFDGVRHASDPQFDVAGNQDAGVWDYTQEFYNAATAPG